jgi:hypothetical protein
MKKTILIPTDFTIESLNAVKTFLSKADANFTYNVILLHGINYTDSITDALFFSKSKFIASISDNEFNEVCAILKNKFSDRINAIRKDIFSGFTQSSFSNYLEANKVEQAYILSNYEMQLPHKLSFDIVPFIKRSSIKVEEIKWSSEVSIPEKGKLAEIFFNGVQTI